MDTKIIIWSEHFPIYTGSWDKKQLQRIVKEICRAVKVTQQSTFCKCYNFDSFYHYILWSTIFIGVNIWNCSI